MKRKRQGRPASSAARCGHQDLWGSLSDAPWAIINDYMNAASNSIDTADVCAAAVVTGCR